MEKSMEQKMLSTMELLAEKLMLLDEKVDGINATVDEISNGIDALGIRIDDVEKRLNARIDEVKMVLREEMKTVYQVATENKEKIDKLLIPYQDRAVYVIDEVAKIKGLEENVEMITEKVGNHSEAIRNMQEYLRMKKKTGKTKIHIFKNYKLD